MRFATFLLAVCAFAQVETPSIGIMLDASGAWRPVYGVAGNFTLGPPREAPDESPAMNTVERRGEVVFVLRPDGAVLDTLPSATGPVLITAHGAVFVDGELVLRRPDASEVRFALSGVAALRVMSTDWVQVTTTGGSYALRIESGREALFVLPATTRAEVHRR